MIFRFFRLALCLLLVCIVGSLHADPTITIDPADGSKLPYGHYQLTPDVTGDPTESESPPDCCDPNGWDDPTLGNIQWTGDLVDDYDDQDYLDGWTLGTRSATITADVTWYCPGGITHTEYGVTKTATYTIWTIKGTTVSTKPTDRQRTTVGVAEEVDFTIDSGGGSALAADWYEDGVQKATSKTTFRWKAPDVATPQVKIKAVIDGYSEEKTYKVEIPSGYKFTKKSSADLTNPNNGDVGMKLNSKLEILPDTVSFYNVQFEQSATTGGNFNGMFDGHALHNAVQFISANYDNKLAYTDVEEFTLNLVVADSAGGITTVDAMGNVVPARAMIPADAQWVQSEQSETFDINWRVAGGAGAGTKLATVSVIYTVNDDGTLRIEKDQSDADEQGAK